jgi:hypothetical protein
MYAMNKINAIHTSIIVTHIAAKPSPLMKNITPNNAE